MIFNFKSITEYIVQFNQYLTELGRSKILQSALMAIPSSAWHIAVRRNPASTLLSDFSLLKVVFLDLIIALSSRTCQYCVHVLLNSAVLH